MTRLTGPTANHRSGSSAPSTSALLHDLTEIMGTLVGRFPLIPFLPVPLPFCPPLPFPLPLPSCASCSGCGSTFGWCSGCSGSGGSGPCCSGSCRSSLTAPGGALPCFQTETCTPCWLPEELGSVEACAAPGGVVRVVVAVRNQSLQARQLSLSATGPDSAWASGAPSARLIAPMSADQLIAVIRLPASADPGTTFELTIWVRGGLDHVIPVKVVATEGACDATAHRHVTDQVDTCHTWKDHFAVSRPVRPVHDG